MVPASNLVLGGSHESSIREEQQAVDVPIPVRQMKSIELTEMVGTWFDSELAGEEQRRYVSYLYNGEQEGRERGKKKNGTVTH